jgi:endonuclease-3
MGDVPSLLSATSKKGGKAGKRSHPTTPPPHWEEMYELTKAMRLSNPAPVDTMGCERLADPSMSAKTQRFHTLIALMLSSQTKDTVTSVAMQRLRTELPGGLTLESILAVEPAELDRLIAAVGFHRRKTDYIKRTAVILRDDWDGDIPDSLEGLVSLPGVGPKMAHLCMSAAWDKTMGIGVDVHVHRICNLWGWVDSTTPEGTREQLEAWLPRDKWREINWLLVGFGQTICLPRGRKCGDCKLSNGLCKVAYVGDAAKGARKGRAKLEVEKEEEEWKLEGEASGKRRPKKITVKIKEEEEDLGEVKGEMKGEKDGDFKLENGGTPRSRRLRKPVKTEIKKEDEWMPDIEDVVGP